MNSEVKRFLKSRRRVYLALALCLCLTGCDFVQDYHNKAANTQRQFAVVQESGNASEAADTDAQDAIAAEDDVTFTLYFPDSSYQNLVPVTRTVTRYPELTEPEQALFELLQGPIENSNLMPILIGETGLRALEVSRGIARVNFSNMPGQLSESECYVATMAIASTLKQFPQIQTVLLDECLTYYGQRFAQPISEVGADFFGGFLSHQYRADSMASADLPDSLQVNAVLYYPDRNGQFILPEVRQTRILSGNWGEMVIQELKRGPQDTTLGRTAAPDSLRLAGEIEMEVNQDGEMGLFVPLTGLSEEQLQGRAGYLLIASLVASLTALRPDFDYVMLQVDDRLITEIPGTDLGFENGHISRQAAIEALGDVVPLYFVDDQGRGLVQVQRAVSALSRKPGEQVIGELIAGAYPQEAAGVSTPLCADLTLKDVIEIGVNGQCLYVNLAASGYDKLNSTGFFAAPQRLYAVVDTLTEVYDTSQVRFLLEGAAISDQVGNLALSEPLMRNPGIILKNR